MDLHPQRPDVVGRPRGDFDRNTRCCAALADNLDWKSHGSQDGRGMCEGGTETGHY